MSNAALQSLVERFHANLQYYKETRKNYNEHSCRIEYIQENLIISLKQTFHLLAVKSSRSICRHLTV